MSTKPELSDLIFRAFVARRELLRTGDGAARHPDHRLSLLTGGDGAARFRRTRRGSRTRGSISRTSTTPPCSWRASALRPRDVPVVITPDRACCARATPGEFAQHLGLTYRAVPGLPGRPRRRRHRPGRTGGRGLRRVAKGSTPSRSTRSRRRPGRRELAHRELRRLSRTASRARISSRAPRSRRMRLGARLNAPCEVGGLRIEQRLPRRRARRRQRDPDPRGDRRDRARGTGGSTSTISNASRARASTTPPPTSRPVPARAASVVVVGGGNSAGQAAIYLAQQGSAVSLVDPRATSSAETMSHYLIERIEADPRIEVLHAAPRCARSPATAISSG